MESKLPRAVLGVLVGVAFGVSGAIFQTTLRNPLASPDIIGISLGASAAAVVAIVLLGPARARRSPSSPWSARSGSPCWSGWPPAPAAGYRLVLVGIGVAAALQAVIQYVFTRVDEYDAQLVLRWLDRQREQRRLADDPGAVRWLLLVLLPVTALRGPVAAGDRAAARTPRPGSGVTPRAYRAAAAARRWC